MITPLLRWAACLVLVLPLRAQTVSEYFVFKGTIYEQTAVGSVGILADPTPHAPGPYYINVGVAGTTGSAISPAPSFTGPGVGSTNLTMTNATRWDFKAGYTTQAGLDDDYENGAYAVTIPGYNGGSPINLSLSGTGAGGNDYPTVIPQVTNLASQWSGGVLQINAAASTTLTFSDFTQYTLPSTSYRQIFAIVPPSGNHFGAIAVSAFNDPKITSFTITPGMLTAGTTYRVVLEYDILTARDITSVRTIDGDPSDATGMAIFSNQTQFYITAVPEPSTYALLAGGALFGIAAWRRRMRGSRA